MQGCLDQLPDVVVAHDLCTTIGPTTIDQKFTVPVLSVKDEMLVDPGEQPAEEAIRAFLETLGGSNIEVVTVEEYQDGQDRAAAGLFRVSTRNLVPDREFMSRLAEFNKAQNPDTGPVISLNFVYSVSQAWRFHPFSPPLNVPASAAPTAGGSGGADRVIAVFDSVLQDPAATTIPIPTWLDVTLNGPFATYPSAPPSAPFPAVGHGVFIATLIKRFAPEAEVHAWGIAENVDKRGGLITIGDVQSAMSAAFEQETDEDKPHFQGAPPDVVNLSLGGPGCAEVEPAVFGRFLTRVTDPTSWTENDTAPVIVAAAGNSSADVIEYPAAFSASSSAEFVGLHDTVIGVGSLTAGPDQDCFSNVGAWIGIWGPGTDQVSYYPYNSGWGSWSGTSFATARVTAMLATATTSPVTELWDEIRTNVTVPPTGFSTAPQTVPKPCP